MYKRQGWDILSNKGKLLDAIEISSNVTELDPEDTSVGYGGLPNEQGVVQLDASIMYGPTHNCGSVAALEGIKTPCSVARLVMERTDHIHIVGKGAQDFARAHGFKVENLLTENARKIWLRWKENLSIKTIIKNDSGLKANEYIYFDIAPHDIEYNSNVRFQAKYKFIEEIPMLLHSFYDVTKFTTAEKNKKPQKRNDYAD